MSSEWPRPYTYAELEAIAKSAARDTLHPIATAKLQEAVEAYQWAKGADEDRWLGSERRSANKRRRKELQSIIQLCEEDSVDEVSLALNELDGPTSQCLKATDLSNLQDVKNTAERALRNFAVSGPDRKRARRQFIRSLFCIFAIVTGENPARRVKVRNYLPHDEQEYGPTLDFVRAALEPFKDTRGCEADLKWCLRDLRERRAKTARKREFNSPK